ncbi:hypothetical protein Q0F99_08500 [Rathayibacter oskolensis]|nr:hypothetical protein [Rathayibacter oskolensis]WKK72896.1 hypothetical protein Q0F99_08500 [Rathayibacter oskolensis]
MFITNALKRSGRVMRGLLHRVCGRRERLPEVGLGLGAVQQVRADRRLAEDGGVVGGDGAGIAPVPVEPRLGQHRGGAAHLEQARGHRHDVGHRDLLRLELADLHAHVVGRPLGLVRVPALAHRGVVARDVVHEGLDRGDPARELADDGLHPRILARQALARDAEGAGAPAHEAQRVLERGPADARHRRLQQQVQQEPEVERVPVGLGRDAVDVLVAERHVVEDRGAAGGEALAEAGPVVEHLHAGSRGRHDGAVALSGGVERAGPRVVGVQRAGRVELAAREPPLAVDAGEPRLRRGGAALLGLRVREQRARARPAQPLLVALGAADEEALDEPEVAAQRLREVRVGRAELDQEREQLGERRSRSTERDRHAQCGEAGGDQRGDLGVQQPPLLLALARLDADLGDHGAEAGEIGRGEAHRAASAAENAPR